MRKVGIFIDGANQYAACKAVGFDIDYGKLKSAVMMAIGEDPTRVARVNYYTAVLEGGDGFVSIAPLLDWLEYHGYTVVTKPAKVFENAGEGPRKVKGNMDVEMVVDVLTLAPKLDVVVLMTGDGDFTALVAELQRQNVWVVVVSTFETSPSMCADELRRQADQFVRLEDLRAAISKPRKVREES